MDPSSPVADLTAFFIQVIGSLLFGLVFLFLGASRAPFTSACGRRHGGCVPLPRCSASSC